jgi:hypothetical protein
VRIGGDAEPPVQLHAAPVGDVHLRVPGGRGIALHQDGIHAMVVQLQGERQSNRAGTDHQD